MATKTGRLEIRAAIDFLEKLEQLATASGTSKANIIDRAVGLYAQAFQEAEKGNVISFVPVMDAGKSARTIEKGDVTILSPWQHTGESREEQPMLNYSNYTV
jgi:hypothetical protein